MQYDSLTGSGVVSPAGVVDPSPSVVVVSPSTVEDIPAVVDPSTVVDTGTVIVRVNQSKLRRDHEELGEASALIQPPPAVLLGNKLHGIGSMMWRYGIASLWRRGAAARRASCKLRLVYVLCRCPPQGAYPLQYINSNVHYTPPHPPTGAEEAYV